MGPDPAEASLNKERDLEARELFRRFQEFPVLRDPLEFPFSLQLAADGHALESVPLMPERSTTAFLAARVVWRNLEIHFRQPDDASLLICNIQRVSRGPVLGSPLLALGSFLRYAVHRSPLLDVIGGCVSKSQNADEGNLEFPRLREFYIRLVGDLHEYRDLDVVWLFGLTRRPARYNEQKIWSRREA
jgi:hypothetical protein